MIRRETKPIPSFSIRENHGLLIAFLAKRYRRDRRSSNFLQDMGITVHYSYLAYRTYPAGQIGSVDLLDCVDGEPDSILPITHDSARKYASDSAIRKFEGYDPQDQFDYLYQVYHKYCHRWTDRRDKHSYKFVFCSGCGQVAISSEDDIFYECEEIGCTSSYCQECVSSKDVLEYLSSLYGLQWCSGCRCLKHTSLFSALYTLFVLEPGVEEK